MKVLMYKIFLLIVLSPSAISIDEDEYLSEELCADDVKYKGNVSSPLIVHFKCRNGFYPRTNYSIPRQPVPETLVGWEVNWPDYKPKSFTSHLVTNKVWADKDIVDTTFEPKWNAIDGDINRKSFLGSYDVVDNYPLNPFGRTGLVGRGYFSRWGPNHIVNPFVTRWKMGQGFGNRVKDVDTDKYILQLLVHRKVYTQKWTVPDAILKMGESTVAASKRAFLRKYKREINHRKAQEQLRGIAKEIDTFFDNIGQEVFRGYFDDPLNTDNAWTEVVAMHFYQPTSLKKLIHFPGDDLFNIVWMDINKHMPLYSSQNLVVKKIVENLDANW